MYEIYTKIPLVFILPYVNVQHYYGMYKKKVQICKLKQRKLLQFPDFDDIYCKYCFTFGPDWLVTSVSIISDDFIIFTICLYITQIFSLKEKF